MQDVRPVFADVLCRAGPASLRIGDMTPTLAEVAPRNRYRKVVALTGAGISAAAGLATFRGIGGLWTARPDLATAMESSLLPGNLPVLWDVWGGIRRQAIAAGPSPAHLALARAQVQIITQNVDGLHQDAGSRDVLELHGSAARDVCLEPPCDYVGDIDFTHEPEPGHIPACPACGGRLRPDVVLFGEPLDPDVWEASERAVRDADLVLAIGTSAFVTPARWLIPIARRAGALCVNVNLDDDTPYEDDFHAHVVGDCQKTVPAWLIDA